MKKQLIIIFFLCFTCLLQANPKFQFGNQDPKLFINNYILANINGKPITVVDVMKKMDVIFFRQYPEYRDSVAARVQFYQQGWKDTLQQLIDKELIVADAIEANLEISNGDIRQELENMFGPNIIANLDQIGMSFDDAWEIVKDEIIIRRMLYFRADAKATKRITPQSIHDAYIDYAKNHPRSAEWRYQVITTQDDALANEVHKLLTKSQLTLDELAERFPKSILTISDEFSVNEEEISETHKSILVKLEDDTYSEPTSQTSRKSNTTAYRIFYLKETSPGGMIPFSEIESALTDQLTNISRADETEKYLTRLRQHFRVEEDYIAHRIPSDLQPFVMK